MEAVINKQELKNVIGGATYTAKCPYCPQTYSTTYWPLLTSLNTAKVICESKLQNHINLEHYL